MKINKILKIIIYLSYDWKHKEKTRVLIFFFLQYSEKWCIPFLFIYF